MRFLKNKILLAREALDRKLASSSSPIITSTTSYSENEFEIIAEHNKNTINKNIISESRITLRQKPSRCIQKEPVQRVLNPEKVNLTGNFRATKNIVVNFGKAIASFAASSLAFPYLADLIEKENITSADFTQFINKSKSKIGGIDSFRNLLLINEDCDAPKLQACKRVFAGIAEIFIKYFSVNWITHGRVTHKLVYLKYRFKILRRIRNPEMFTYISEAKKR